VKIIQETSATHNALFRVMRSNTEIAITPPRIARLSSDLVHSFMITRWQDSAKNPWTHRHLNSHLLLRRHLYPNAKCHPDKINFFVSKICENAPQVTGLVFLLLFPMRQMTCMAQ